ncbi:MAG: aminoglycoside phosphotransferase family protein [Bacteroidota bacterium]
MEKLATILKAYGFAQDSVQAEPLGNGLINETWKLKTADRAYVLQRINNTVFTEPATIAYNIGLITDYMNKQFPEYMFVSPVPLVGGEQMIYREGMGYFRLFPFINGSHSKDVVGSAEEAYEAASQFGKFTKLLSDFDVAQLKITLPHFHDLSYRYNQFTDALANGNRNRIKTSTALINFIKQHNDIVDTYELIKANPDFKKRVIHHDTKISNVLFNDANKSLCVIDLDTVMPGFFISDVGDMFRTYLSPVSEEETDLGKIKIREDLYKAIVSGYCREMENELTNVEKRYFFYAGKFMIYMQATRFLTDHINDDIYYGANYPGHNFNRAENQVTLLKKLMEKKAVLVNYADSNLLKDQL